MKITEDFVETMLCPACGGRMQLNTAADAIKCRACRRVYQIKDDIPDMLVEHATIETETPTHAS